MKCMRWPLVLGLIALALVTTSCVKRYKVTAELSHSVSHSTEITVGEFVDNLPPDMDQDKKPTIEDVDGFKNVLLDQISEEMEKLGPIDNPLAGPLVVQGSILEYKKGNGFLRFMFGAWAGAAKVTVNIKLMDPKTNQEIFAGNFTGAVTDGLVSGAAMWKTVAKDFAKELRKQTEQFGKSK